MIHKAFFNRPALIFPSVFILIAGITLFSGCAEERKEEISENDVRDEVIFPSDSLPSYRIININPRFVDSVLKLSPQFNPVTNDVRSVYETENYRTMWFGRHGMTEQTGKIINLISTYFENGILDSTILVKEVLEKYRLITSPDFQMTDNDTMIMESDVMFTAQFLLIASEAWQGIGEKKARKLEWFLPIKQTSFTEYLRKALTDTSATEQIPVFMQYKIMVEKLEQYHKIMKSGGFTVISSFEKNLVPGDTSSAIIQIRKRLYEEGFRVQGSSDYMFDDSLADIIRQSRVCFGLNDTALIDQKLINELNEKADDRIRKMLINLERWKWIPDHVSERYIVVNLPDYMLHVFENGKRIKSMKVIIGKETNQTVIFSGNISQVVFSPYWIIPASITMKEILPSVRKNKNYLRANNMEIVNRSGNIIDDSEIDWTNHNQSFPYTIRQRPGPSNSLGHVKFLFPNNYAIYLHDTPARHLFGRNDRMFSHGCIRIEEPKWLAEYLLADQPKWDSISIEKAMHSGKETAVKTKSKIPVYITYFTSWVDSQGRLHFRDDVYGHDRKLERELFGD